MKKLKHWFLAGLIIISATAAVDAQQYSGDVAWLIEELQLKEGSVVADIGAGDGNQTLAIARYVGDEGHVFSTELGPRLQSLQRAVERAQSSNITVIEGAPKQTNLPPECCDALYMRRVYHHITEPASMNASLMMSLKPGGRLAVIDFEPWSAEADPEERASGSHHGVTTETVVRELRQAGFVLISAEQQSSRNIYVIMEKPENME